jgi:Mn-dependent DtxR family transcriptional regulator
MKIVITYDDENIAEVDAEGIEHHIHAETLKKLEVFVNNIKNIKELGMTQASKK